MPSDVSDEALNRLLSAFELTDDSDAVWLRRDELLAFAKRIRDLTAARCVEACEQLAKDHTLARDKAVNHDNYMQAGDYDSRRYAAEEAAEAIEALFPGAAKEVPDDRSK